MRASGWDREEDNIVGGEKVRELRCPVVGGIVSIIYILKFLIIYKRVVLERQCLQEHQCVREMTLRMTTSIEMAGDII